MSEVIPSTIEACIEQTENFSFAGLDLLDRNQVCPATSHPCFPHCDDCVFPKGHPKCECQGFGVFEEEKGVHICPAFKCTLSDGSHKVSGGQFRHPKMSPGGFIVAQPLLANITFYLTLDRLPRATTAEEFLVSFVSPIRRQNRSAREENRK